VTQLLSYCRIQLKAAALHLEVATICHKATLHLEVAMWDLEDVVLMILITHTVVTMIHNWGDIDMIMIVIHVMNHAIVTDTEESTGVVVLHLSHGHDLGNTIDRMTELKEAVQASPRLLLRPLMMTTKVYYAKDMARSEYMIRKIKSMGFVLSRKHCRTEMDRWNRRSMLQREFKST
jgi:hypothetical protein